jgi:broad specificity phosphatase PhoE
MFKPKDLKIEKTVYFVRHGQSEANAQRVYQAPDSPLNAEGKKQAGLIAERISKLSFETLIASPFPRAKETAEIIGTQVGKSPEFSDLFIESERPSVINGRPYGDKEADDIWRTWDVSRYTSGVRVLDGDNYDDLITRADKALSFLKERTEKNIVVVTHGYFLRVIVARVLLGNSLTGDALRKFIRTTSTENTGLTVLKYQAGFEEGNDWRLWVYNDHAHLG